MRIQPMTSQALRGITSPAAVPGGNTEAFAFTLYDTAAVATATTTETFYTTLRANRQLSNLDSPGSLDDPKYFNIFSIHVTPLIAVASAADNPAAIDMDELTRVNSGTLSLIIQDKEYGPWPITQAGGLGGVTGFGLSLADATATSQLWANNGIQGTGIPIAGSLWLVPKAGFRVVLDWGAAITLSATRNVQVAMCGVLYRAIL